MQQEKLENTLSLLALSLSIDFSKDDVKRNYFALAKLYHPNYKKVQDEGVHYHKVKEAYHFIMKHFDEIKALNRPSHHTTPKVYETVVPTIDDRQEDPNIDMHFTPQKTSTKQTKKRHFKVKRRFLNAKRIGQLVIIVSIFLLLLFAASRFIEQA